MKHCNFCEIQSEDKKEQEKDINFLQIFLADTKNQSEISAMYVKPMLRKDKYFPESNNFL